MSTYVKDSGGEWTLVGKDWAPMDGTDGIHAEEGHSELLSQLSPTDLTEGSGIGGGWQGRTDVEKPVCPTCSCQVERKWVSSSGPRGQDLEEGLVSGHL